MSLSAWASGVRQLLYPGRCWHCGRPLPPTGTDFCAACVVSLSAETTARCPRCAATVGLYADTTSGCTFCRDERWAFDRVVRLGPYEEALRAAILTAKYRNGEGLAEALGALFAHTRFAELHALGAELIVPVPLHWWRRVWERGYNQSAPLAEALARKLQVPFSESLLRQRATLQQSTQSPTARRENVRGAFRLRRWARVAGRCVLLVDDVLTTGSTAHECARVLQAAGAARVEVAVLARATGT